MKWRPGTSPVIRGATSSPTYSRRLIVDFPGSTPIYDPENSVPSPDTIPPAIRGLTTQNCVSSTKRDSASLTSSTVTSTSFPLSASVIPFTSPTSTDLYLTLVLPASRPSAVLKVIVIVGPLSMMPLTTSQPPINAAMIGINQINCTDQPRLRTARASGRSVRSKSGGGLFLTVSLRVPDQLGFELHRRNHRQHHDCAEGHGPITGLDRGQRL